MVHHWDNRRRIRSASKKALKARTVALEGWDLAEDSLPDYFFPSLTIHFWPAPLSGVGKFEAVRT